MRYLYKQYANKKMNILIISLFPAAVLGTINWIYWRQRGYSNWGNIILSYIAFFGISYMILKTFI